MPAIDISLLMGVLGTLLSVSGLLVAWIQTAQLRKLKREENADVWLTIRLLKSMFQQLESSKLKDDNVQVARAYDSALSMFRTQLKRAILFEKDYSMTTIRKWQSAGKISSDWQTKQALNFLESTNIDLYHNIPTSSGNSGAGSPIA